MSEGLDCGQARGQIQEGHDAGSPLRPEVIRHLEGCASCRRFQRTLASMGRKLRGAARDALAGLGPPDTDRIFAVAAARRNRLRWAGLAAAACLAAAAGTGVALKAQADRRARAAVRIETERLVEALFSRPFLEDLDSAAAEQLAAAYGGRQEAPGQPTAGER